MAEKIRWGIIGTGNIAHQFAQGLKHLDDAVLVAVGSRSQESADKFGDEFGVTHCHPSYEALVSDPDVDVIYVSSPHPMHKENTLLCLENGKAVLVEKPFAMNADDTAEMVRVAREKKLFMMEAMWTRFMPRFVRLKQMLDEGVLGEIYFLQADFGFATTFNPEHRLFAPELGGGALLDVGIYPVSLASFIYQEQPEQIASFARKAATGTDDVTTMSFQYKNHATANLHCAVRLNTPCEAWICGEKGRIKIHRQWHGTVGEFTLHLYGGGEQVISAPIEGSGYRYEAAAVGQCLREGKLESNVMPLDESIAIMQTMDRIQAQWQ